MDIYLLDALLVSDLVFRFDLFVIFLISVSVLNMSSGDAVHSFL